MTDDYNEERHKHLRIRITPKGIEHLFRALQEGKIQRREVDAADFGEPEEIDE